MFTVSKKKWICFSIYRPPSTENIKRFFEERNELISKDLCKFEYLIVMGDFNIDIRSSNSDKDKLENFCDLFNLTNLVHSETCFMKNSQSIIDLILTNKPLHFQNTHVVETGLSNYHKMISTFFKACLSKLKTKVICIEVIRNLMNQISYAVSKKQILTFSKTILIRTTTFSLISSSVPLKRCSFEKEICKE